MAILNLKNFPDDLAKKVKQSAKQQRRSVAQQVVVLLERALSDPASYSVLELRGLGKRGTDANKHVKQERDAW